MALENIFYATIEKRQLPICLTHAIEIPGIFAPLFLHRRSALSRRLRWKIRYDMDAYGVLANCLRRRSGSSPLPFDLFEKKRSV